MLMSAFLKNLSTKLQDLKKRFSEMLLLYIDYKFVQSHFFQ